MPTITKSIGTASRDYASLTLWEADLDNGAVYASGDDAVGECYNDSAFDESVTIDGGGTVGLASITLTVATGERHDGTAGTGARIVMSGAYAANHIITAQSVARPVFVRWLEIDANGFRHTTGATGSLISISGAGFAHGADHAILHGWKTTASSGTGSNCNCILSSSNVSGDVGNFLNNVIYGCAIENASNAANMSGIVTSNRTRNILNNTVHGFTTTGTGVPVGIVTSNSSLHTTTNCLVTEFTTCFNAAASATRDHNASSDATASGTGSLTSIVTADQYVSTVVGSEELLLKSGAGCIDAGVNLGTTPAGVNIDILGRDRDAEGDTTDIGAHEFVAAGGGFIPYPFSRGARGGAHVLSGGMQ